MKKNLLIIFSLISLAVLAQSAISVSPANISFGDVAIGSDASKTITIKNNTSSSVGISIGGVTSFVPPNSSLPSCAPVLNNNFIYIDGETVGTVPANDSVMLMVKFAPKAYEYYFGIPICIPMGIGMPCQPMPPMCSPMQATGLGNYSAQITISQTGTSLSFTIPMGGKGATLTNIESQEQNTVNGVYPNPATETIYLPTNYVFVGLQNALGNRIMVDAPVNGTMNVSQLPSGIYTMELLNGDKKIVHKLVKN